MKSLPTRFRVVVQKNVEKGGNEIKFILAGKVSQHGLCQSVLLKEMEIFLPGLKAETHETQVKPVLIYIIFAGIISSS